MGVMVEVGARAETSATVEVGARAETSATVEVGARAETSATVETTVTSGGGAIRVWWVALSLLLSAVYGCSSRSEVGVEGDSAAFGALTLPLTYESEAGRYRLAATFSVYDQPVSPGNEPEPVLTLTSQPPPKAAVPQLSAELPAGEYWVALKNWRLYRDESDVWVGVDAEPTATVAAVTILAEQTSTVTFRFVTTPPAGPRGGTVVVDFTVTQGALCGNGVLEPGEVCDDGLLNGLPDKCRVTCTPPDEPPPPLRVSPDSSVNGSGTSWDDPTNDLQAALDQQSAAGGGEVWVLGGYFAALGSQRQLLQVPSNVTLRGGFIGIEATADARDPNYPPTTFSRYDEQAPNVPMIELTDVEDVLLERIELTDTAFAASGLVIKGSHRIVLRDINFVAQEATPAVLEQSEVRLENSDFTIGRSSFHVTGSDLTVVESTIAMPDYGVLYAESSRVLLQDSVSHGLLIMPGVNSKLLLNRSIVTLSSSQSGMISSDGDVTLVASALLDSAPGDTPLRAASAFVFDSTFAELKSGAFRGSVSESAGVAADRGEVALSTFFNAECSEDGFLRGCRQPLILRDNGPVHHSVFVSPRPYFHPPESDPYEWFFNYDAQQFANCASFDVDAFERSTALSAQVLATNHPCIDAGDAAALEASRQRLLERVSEFLAPPFNADLSRYRDPDFWRHSTARTDTAEDTGAPDPGRHW